MNAFRKRVRLVTGLIFATATIFISTVATPCLAAPQKTYSMNVVASATYHVDPTSLQPAIDVPVPISVTIKNESPPSTANSNISSFSFSVAGMTIFSIDANACVTSGAICTLDTGTNTVSVTNISPPIQAQSTFTVSLNVSSCGDGVWAAKVYGGSQLNGSVFGGTKSVETKVKCGDADCGSPFAVADANGTSPGSPLVVSGSRGQYDKSGNTCSVVDYFVTNTIPTNSTLHFDWQIAPTAAFRYTLNYPQPVTPQVAWLTDSAGPVFIGGQACDVTNAPKNMPAPYGVLTADVTKNATKLKVDTTLYAATNAVLPTPFAIVLGTERMLVTNISNGNWTVQRAQGGTAAAPHTTNDRVMSTPLPLILSSSLASDAGTRQRQLNAGYAVGNQAQMCVAAPASSSWPTTTYDVIDIGDGYVKGSFN